MNTRLRGISSMVQLKRKDLIPPTLVWYPAILVLLGDTLYKELDEITDEIYPSSTKHFFP
ncbi:MAG: hypothetical protein M3230_05680 [Thermoproteota archaeon]|nr:hypothetical protein [Thermoproteota archaeon]